MAQGGGIVCRLVGAVAVVTVVALLIVLVISVVHPAPPRYYASVVSVSGLDVDYSGRQPLNFTLALGVQSRSWLWRRRACIEQNTTVGVAYHGVQLAHGSIGSWEACAVPRETSTVQTLVMEMSTTSNMTGLPESVVGGMVADARRGVHEFDVTFWMPSPTTATGRVGGDDGMLVSCMTNANACDVHF